MPDATNLEHAPVAASVRPARSDEAPVLEALQWRASLVWEEDRAALLAHPDAIEVSEDAIRAGYVRVAVAAHRVVGFSVVLPAGVTVIELDGLFVEPDQMRRGIGRLLIDDAIERARARGLLRIEVTANPRAVGFYRKLGFLDDGTVATRFGPGLRMHREVQTSRALSAGSQSR